MSYLAGRSPKAQNKIKTFSTNYQSTPSICMIYMHRIDADFRAASQQSSHFQRYPKAESPGLKLTSKFLDLSSESVFSP
ncbi:hypothetical protein L3X38_013560 [Prunus dulcis]|uniref:Uncharacterized protein n=1 Tax=Prunus dulcis TaxID=3755 RepID=A0AAD4ZHN4_PRUDU|nr:hypothetical protein L3X38_013560 [Prunus dulcis]